MAYLPLSSASHRQSDMPAVASTTSQSRSFGRRFMPSMRRTSFDELPLIESPLGLKLPSKNHDSASYIVNVVESDCDTNSMFENAKDHTNVGSLDRSDSMSPLRARLNSAYRYLRASGPAKPPVLSESITADGPSRMPTGWRLGTCVCCAAVILCIIIEVALLVYAIKTSVSKGSGVLLEGNCKEIRESELWLLLPLNIAGTVLLGTSNYVMQVLSAPDRKEIDRAHAFARPIAVGGVRFNEIVPSKGNGLRRTIWWILGATSLPIHFLLNVAIYSSVQASNTGVLVVSDDFDNDSGWDYCKNISSSGNSTEANACSLYQNYVDGKMLTMTTSQCLQQYSNGFQTNASSVIVVTGQQYPPWYNIPLTAKVPDSVSYGDIPCRTDSSGKYSKVSDLNYVFVSNSTVAYTTVSLDFTPFCQNQTNRTKDGHLISSTIVPTSRSDTNLNYTSYDDLFLRQNDALSDITSIKALFSAFQYRYWAVADISGDYLRPDYASLLQTRDPRTWLCPRGDLEANQQCDPVDVQKRSEWLITPNSMSVQKCHVLPKVELCTLHYSTSILAVTIFFDVVKLSAMIAAVTWISNPLTTLGDIIDSFLRVPDPYTDGRGPLDDELASLWAELVNLQTRRKAFAYVRGRFGPDFLTKFKCDYCDKETKHDPPLPAGFQNLISAHSRCGKMSANSDDVKRATEEAFKWLSEGGLWWTTVVTDADAQAPRILERRRWYEVPSRHRWVWSILLYLPALMLAVLYFTINFRSLIAQRLLRPWIVGFNAPDPNSLLTGYLSGTTSIYGAALLVNAPQVAFSLLYFIFNATLTMMHTAHEWASFARSRKALRVSSPRGQQRATYWLQLPWSYSIPLIAVSGSMHWLLSRSLYIVKVDVYGYFGEREMDKDYFACGYSPIPALLLIVVLASMGISLAALSFRWLPGGMPLVRLNSLAIAAACQPDPDEKNIELEPLMWGQLQNYSKNGKPHYSFSARQVISLESHRVPRDWRRTLSCTPIWPFKPQSQSEQPLTYAMDTTTRRGRVNVDFSGDSVTARAKIYKAKRYSMVDDEDSR